MGLLLSVLVVCVGVLEAMSCVRHFQHGYLPFWGARARRPMMHERPRRKPNEDSSDDDTSDELSRILRNGGGVNINRAESPSYGLTPILTEHRRNTPILRDSEDDDEEVKYVANNIDEPSYTGCCRDGLTERFRPISPPEHDGPVDESYVSQTGKFLELPPDGDSPLQRSSSEETLHDSEIEDRRPSALDEAPCPVVEHDLEPDAGPPQPDGVVFQIDSAPPLGGREQMDGDDDLQTDEINDDSDLMTDPVYNLVSAAAYILSNDPERELPSRRSPHGTASSMRPLNLDMTARIPTPQTHRESIPFDLAAAHAHTSSSRPDTPTTPRKSKADISWPVFHPEPVIKRPIIELSRGESIEEILDVPDDVIPEPHSSYLKSEVLEDECSKVTVKSLSDVPATPFMVIPGCRRVGSHRSGDTSPPPPPCKTSFDRFGRITCAPHKGRYSKKRRGSLERPAVEGALKDNLLSKSLPDFFFEEKAQSDAAAKMADDEVAEESVSLGKDITPKESSIKRRRSYREKKRSTWTPNKSRSVRDAGVVELLSESETESETKPKKSLFEIDNESLDEFGGSDSESVVSKKGLETEAIVNSELTPVEVLHHAEVRPESAVFATPRQQPKTRLKKPIKAESFEEAMPPDPKTRLEQPIKTESFEATPPDPKTRLQKPIKAESFDEATPPDPKTRLEQPIKAESFEEATPPDPKTRLEQPIKTEFIEEATPPDPKTRLEQPIKAESFEEATPPDPKSRLEQPIKAESFEEATPPDPKTRLEQPIKAESFDEATPPCDDVTGGSSALRLDQTLCSNTTETALAHETNSKSLVKTPVETDPKAFPQPQLPTVDTPITSDVSKPPCDSASKPDETKTNEDEDEEEEDDTSASETDTSNINQPQQSSQPGPFWLIFSGEYTKAMSKDWHSGHFCCWQCDESLTGQRYVLRDDHPYCIKCYESVFANMCEECSKTIGIDSKDLSYKDKHWHEACFLCNKCRVSLVDKQFGSKADKIYCSNCYDAQFASRCDGCGEIFRAGTKKMEYKTRQWHEKCFCCCVCKSAIGTKSFIPREQEIYCATCYEEKFATRCVKCNKIITSGGVTYKNEPWHRECFTCTHCNTSLAGQRFTSRDEKPYCAECFGELFAKRCTACVKPITGIGGTRFISFEDRHWHNDCFICATCKTSLVGRGFITDAEDIICPECAKQKLM